MADILGFLADECLCEIVDTHPKHEWIHQSSKFTEEAREIIKKYLIQVRTDLQSTPPADQGEQSEPGERSEQGDSEQEV